MKLDMTELGNICDCGMVSLRALSQYDTWFALLVTEPELLAFAMYLWARKGADSTISPIMVMRSCGLNMLSIIELINKHMIIVELFSSNAWRRSAPFAADMPLHSAPNHMRHKMPCGKRHWAEMISLTIHRARNSMSPKCVDRGHQWLMTAMQNLLISAIHA